MPKQPTQENNMVLRGGIYHCRLDIPKDLKEHYEFKNVRSKSLGTGDKRLAIEKRDKLISEWKSEFRAKREARQLLKENRPDWKEPLSYIGKDIKEICNKLIGEYSRWKDDFIEVKVPNVGNMPFALPPHEINNRLLEAVNHLSVDFSLKLDFCDWLMELDLPQYHSESDFFRDLESHALEVIVKRTKDKFSLDIKEEKQAASIIKDPDSVDLKSPITPAMIKDWKTHLQTQYDNNKTIDGHEFHIRRLSQWLNEVNKPLDFDSIAMFLKTIGNKRATLNKYLSSYRNFWEWANRYNLRFRTQFANKQNPFKDHSLPKNKESRTSERTPFTVKEVEQLFQEAFKKGDHELAYLIAFASYTGARREEIGRISKNSTEFKKGVPSSFKIEEAKTKAGVREVPIHSALVPLYTHLLKQSDENGGFLFSGSKNKYDKRMDAIGKRFGRLKTDLGFSSDHVFHSIRKTAITAMHEQNVPVQEVLSYIVGHESGLITLDVYSGGATMKQKREAIEKLKFNFAQIKSFS